MNLALKPFVALTTAAMSLILAAPAPAQTAAHGIAPVIDGTTPLGPMHGQAQGTWIAPGLQAGHVYAKLYDSQGVERFTLRADLIEYLFLVAAPAQGELSGELLVSPVASGGVGLAMTQIYALVEGTWIQTGNGKGIFTASIMQPVDGSDQPVVQIGLIQGTFNLMSPAPATRVRTNPESSASAATTAGAGSAANGLHLMQPEPPIIVVYPAPGTAAAQGIQLVGDESPRRPLNHHGGLGQAGVGAPGSGSSLGGTTAVNLSQGRLTLRWQLFE